jgi:hypothetical protein
MVTLIETVVPFTDRSVTACSLRSWGTSRQPSGPHMRGPQMPEVRRILVHADTNVQPATKLRLKQDGETGT